MLTFLFCCRPF